MCVNYVLKNRGTGDGKETLPISRLQFDVCDDHRTRRGGAYISFPFLLFYTIFLD